MMHALNRVQTNGTVSFNGVDNGAEGADKHLIHLSQVAVCHDDVDDGADDGDYDSVGNGDDDGVDDCAEGADKHLIHLSQAADCCKADRNEQNKHLVCDKDNDVDDGADDGDYDSVGYGDNGVDDGVDDGADKHLIHLSQVADCCRMNRNKQNEHL
eukprot:4965820-Ditylum_brightwellii.AAC.1